MSHVRFAILAAVSSTMLLGCANNDNSPAAAKTPGDIQARHTHENSDASICAAPMNVTEGAGLYIEDLKTIAGKFKLVRASYQIDAEFTDGNTMAVAVQANLSPNSNNWNPHIKTRVSCKNMDTTPNLIATESFNAPVVINAINGNLTGNAIIGLKAYGENHMKQDKVVANYAVVPEFLDITGYIGKLRRQGKVSIHKMGEKTIEIRFSRAKETTEYNSAHSMVLTYQGQPR